LEGENQMEGWKSFFEGKKKNKSVKERFSWMNYFLELELDGTL